MALNFCVSTKVACVVTLTTLLCDRAIAQRPQSAASVWRNFPAELRLFDNSHQSEIRTMGADGAAHASTPDSDEKNTVKSSSAGNSKGDPLRDLPVSSDRKLRFEGFALVAGRQIVWLGGRRIILDSVTAKLVLPLSGSVRLSLRDNELIAKSPDGSSSTYGVGDVLY